MMSMRTSPRQVRTPLPLFKRHLLPPLSSLAEWIGAQLFSGFVVATEVIFDRFPARKTALVRNFPLLEKQLSQFPTPTPMRDRPLEFTYVGYISEVRNIYAMIEAVARARRPAAQLRLAGSFAVEEMERRARAMPEWSSVRFEGWQSREGVAGILGDGRAGLVVLKPVEH